MFKQNDKLAREVGKAYWKSKGKTAVDNPDRYGPDLVVDGVFTVRWKLNVHGKVKSLNIKHARYHIEKLSIWTKISTISRHIFSSLIMNRIMPFILKAEDVASSPVVEVPNKYVPSGEMFFQVPLDKLNLVELPKDVRQDND